MRIWILVLVYAENEDHSLRSRRKLRVTINLKNSYKPFMKESSREWSGFDFRSEYQGSEHDTWTTRFSTACWCCWSRDLLASNYHMMPEKWLLSVLCGIRPGKEKYIDSPVTNFIKNFQRRQKKAIKLKLPLPNGRVSTHWHFRQVG